MEIQELLEMNVEISTLLNAEELRLPPVMKKMVEKLLDENEAKLKEIEQYKAIYFID